MDCPDHIAVGRYVMTAEERARQKAADAARLTVEVARIRSEVRFGVRPAQG